MPRLSIVIPCIQDADCFEATLASVLQNRPDDCEVLVVQPRSYDDPYQLKDEVRFLQVSADGSLVDLINAGIESARGTIIHLLSCEVEVVEGWTDAAVRHFRDPEIGSVAPLLTDKRSSERVLARGVRYTRGGARQVRRSRVSRRPARGECVLGPTLSAGFYRRQALLEVGGFRSDVGVEWTDVDLGLTLQSAGYRSIHEATAIITTEHTGQSRTLSFRCGLQAERLFWCRAAQSGWVASLLMHPWTVARELVSNCHRPQVLLQAFGRAAACWELVTQRGGGTHPPDWQAARESGAKSLIPIRPLGVVKRDEVVNSRAAA